MSSSCAPPLKATRRSGFAVVFMRIKPVRPLRLSIYAHKFASGPAPAALRYRTTFLLECGRRTRSTGQGRQISPVYAQPGEASSKRFVRLAFKDRKMAARNTK